MPKSTPAKVIFGAALLNSRGGFTSAADITGLLDAAHELGIRHIDTAHAYAESEAWLGEAQAATARGFGLDTKHPGAADRDTPATKDHVLALGRASLAKLTTPQVDVYYLHAPDDARVPVADTLAGLHALYEAGAFRRLGLSNHTVAQVEEVLRVCRERGFVAPTVYQGNYNAVARLPEAELFPLLRAHGIAFYAYSPIAGGFLAKKPADFDPANQDALRGGRWDVDSFGGKMYRFLYSDRRATLAALGAWHAIAAAEGITAAELAFRWVVHNSALDGARGDVAIIGPKDEAQLRSACAAIAKGPLSREVQAQCDAVWEPLRENAFLDNMVGHALIKTGK